MKPKQQLPNTGSTSLHIQGKNLGRETNHCKTNFSTAATKPDRSQAPKWKQLFLWSDAESFLGQHGTAQLFHLLNKEEILKIQIFAVSMHVTQLIVIYRGGSHTCGCAAVTDNCR